MKNIIKLLLFVVLILGGERSYAQVFQIEYVPLDLGDNIVNIDLTCSIEGLKPQAPKNFSGTPVWSDETWTDIIGDASTQYWQVEVYDADPTWGDHYTDGKYVSAIIGADIFGELNVDWNMQSRVTFLLTVTTQSGRSYTATFTKIINEFNDPESGVWVLTPWDGLELDITVPNVNFCKNTILPILGATIKGATSPVVAWYEQVGIKPGNADRPAFVTPYKGKTDSVVVDLSKYPNSSYNLYAVVTDGGKTDTAFFKMHIHSFTLASSTVSPDPAIVGGTAIINATVVCDVVASETIDYIQWLPTALIDAGGTADNAATTLPLSLGDTLFQVVVKDAYCQDTVDVKIKIKGVKLEMTSDTVCESPVLASNVNIGVKPPITGPTFNYAWSGLPALSQGGTSVTIANANAANATVNVKGLAAGTYAVQVIVTNTTAVPNITYTDTTYIGVLPAPVANVLASAADTCKGSNVTLTATSTGGTGNVNNFTYSWSAGATATGIKGQAIAAVSNAGKNAFVVTVTDTEGCTGTDTAKIVGHDITLSGAQAINNAIACGDTVNLVLGSAVCGGGCVNGDLTYQWQPAAKIAKNGTTKSATSVALNESTSFTIIATDKFGCVDSINNIKVDVYGCDFKLALAAADSICQGVTGSYTATTSGSGIAAGYPTFTWNALTSNSGFSFTGNKLTVNSSGLVAGSIYKYEVVAEFKVNGHNITKTLKDTIEIYIHENPVVELNTIPADTCNNSELALTTTIKYESGATVVSPAYAWTAITGGYVTAPGNSATATAKTSLAGGDNKFIVKLTDNKGCFDYDTITTNVHQVKAGTLASVQSLPAFRGTQVDLTLTGTTCTNHNASDVLTYTWLPADSIASYTNTTATTTPRYGDTEFRVVVEDVIGCTDTAKLNVTVDGTPLVIDAQNDTTCAYLYASNDSEVELEVKATGGKLDPGHTYSYNWKSLDGLTFAGSTGISKPKVNVRGVSTGTYRVAVEVKDDLVTMHDTSYVYIRKNPDVKLSGAPKDACADSELALVATPGTGAVGDYTYAWDGGTAGLVNTAAPTVAAGDTTHNTFYVKMTDEYGCYAYDSVGVNGHEISAITITPQYSSTVISGTAQKLYARGVVCEIPSCTPLTYTWKPSSMLNGLSSGNGLDSVKTVALTTDTKYTVVVEDAYGCVDSSSLTIHIGDVKVEVAGDTVCTYRGVGNDFAALQVKSPTGSDYSYAWRALPALSQDNHSLVVTNVGANGARATADIAGLKPGTYAVEGIVTQTSTGVEMKDTAYVLVRENPVVELNTTPADTCNNSELALTTTIKYESGATVVSPAYAWTAITGGYVTAPGNSATATAKTSLAGGDNKFIVKLTDNKGCFDYDTITTNVHQVKAGTLASVQSLPAFRGTQVDLTLTGTTCTNHDASDVLTYTWLPADSIASYTNTTATTTPRYGDTEFRVVVEDAIGCTDTAKLNVTVEGTPLVIDAQNDTTCAYLYASNDSKVELEVKATGGKLVTNPTYRYAWKSLDGLTFVGGGTTSASVKPQVNVKGVSTGTYRVAVEVKDDLVTMHDTSYVYIRKNPDVKLSGAPKDTCADSELALVATPGTGAVGDYTYAWDGGTGGLGINTAAPTVAAGDTTHNTFYVKMTDKYGCYAYDSVGVNGHEISPITITPQYSSTVISGTAQKLYARGVVCEIPSCTPLTYTWKPSSMLDGLSSGNGLDSVKTVALTTDTKYTVVVEDAYGCVDSSSLTIHIGDVKVEVAGDTVCTYRGVGNDFAALQVKSPIGNDYSYAWRALPALSQDNHSLVITNVGANGVRATADIAGLKPGTYAVEGIVTQISTGVEMKDTAYVFIRENPVVELNTIPADTCNNSELALTTTIKYESGATVVSPAYVWTAITGGYVTAPGNSATATAKTSLAGGDNKFIVKLTDNKGCFDYDTITTNVHQVKAGTLASVQSLPAFKGTQVDLTLSGTTCTNHNTSDVLTYTWLPADSIASYTNTTAKTTPRYGNTEFRVVVEDAVGCTDTAKLNVTVEGTPLVIDAQNDTTCAYLYASNDSKVELEVKATGGKLVTNPTYRYAWKSLDGLTFVGGGTTSASVKPQVNVKGMPTGTYRVAVEVKDDLVMMHDTSYVYIRKNPEVKLSGAPKDTCAGSELALVATPGTGAVGDYTYAWDGGTAGLVNTAAPTVAAGDTTHNTFYVKMVDEYGCYAYDSVSVNGHEINAGAILANSPVTGGNVQTLKLNGTQSCNLACTPLTYTWGPVSALEAPTSGNNLDTVITKPLTADTKFFVEVKDGFGCFDTAKVTVKVGSVTVEAQGDTVCAAHGVETLASLDVLQPTGNGYTYAWTPLPGSALTQAAIKNAGQPNASVDVKGLAAGIYGVLQTVTQTATGLNFSDTAYIKVRPNPTAKIIQPADTCFGSKVLLALDKVYANYEWSSNCVVTGVNTPTAIGEMTVNGENQFSVKVTDTNGCWDQDTVSVQSLTTPVIRNISVLDSCGAARVVVVADDANAYNWSWITGAGTLDKHGAGDTCFVTSTAIGGAFNVKVEALNGVCKADTSIAGHSVNIDLNLSLLSDADSCINRDIQLAILVSGVPTSVTGNVELTYGYTSWATGATQVNKTATFTKAELGRWMVLLPVTEAQIGTYELISAKDVNTGCPVEVGNTDGSGTIVKIGDLPLADIDSSYFALYKDSTFVLKVVNPENYDYIWSTFPAGLIADADKASQTVNGKMADDDYVYMLTATSKNLNTCKATDTAWIYRIPDAPLANIDTNTTKNNIKLHWGAVPKADGYTVWSRKWDPYCLTTENGGMYAKELGLTTTAWAEPTMDTLEFYYVTSYRTIPKIGKTYHSMTSDTVGYFQKTIEVNTVGLSNNLLPWYFDMSSKGISTSKDFFAYVNTWKFVEGRRTLTDGVNIFRKWLYPTQVYYASRPLNETVVSQSFSVAVGEVYQLEGIGNGVVYLQYGKLPARVQFSMDGSNAGTNNSLAFIQPSKIGITASEKVIEESVDGYISVVRRWNFATQTYDKATRRLGGTPSNPVYTQIFDTRPMMPLQIEIKNGTNFIWK